MFVVRSNFIKGAKSCLVVLSATVQCFGVCYGFKHIDMLLKLDFKDRLKQHTPTNESSFLIQSEG